MEDLEQTITALWEARDDLASVMPEAEARAAVHEAIELLDTGDARVAEVVGDDVVVHQWLKYAVLLLFRLARMDVTEVGPVRVPRQDPAQAPLRAVEGAGGAGRVGALGLVPRARGDPHAELREHRRARRCRHHGRHLGHRRLVRADRRAGAPVGRRRHRRRARAAAGRAGDRRERRHHRLAVHGHAGRARRRRQRAGRGRDPEPGHPGDRRRDRRRGVARRRAAVEHRRAGRAARGRSRVATSRCRAR